MKTFKSGGIQMTTPQEATGMSAIEIANEYCLPGHISDIQNLTKEIEAYATQQTSPLQSEIDTLKVEFEKKQIKWLATELAMDEITDGSYLKMNKAKLLAANKQLTSEIDRLKSELEKAEQVIEFYKDRNWPMIHEYERSLNE